MAEGFAGWLAKLNIAMELKSTETIKQAVIAGMGVAFLSAHTVTLERQSELVVLDVQGFPLMLNWYVVHRKKQAAAAGGVRIQEIPDGRWTT